MIHDTHPKFSRSQVSTAWHQSIKHYGGVLARFESQGSSSDRSGAITKANEQKGSPTSLTASSSSSSGQNFEEGNHVHQRMHAAGTSSSAPRQPTHNLSPETMSHLLLMRETHDGPQLPRTPGNLDEANLDEASNIANAGSMKVVGDRTLRKHERNLDDSRVSITSVDLGTAAGTERQNTSNLNSGMCIKHNCNTKINHLF
jgi:hypothetical protein